MKTFLQWLKEHELDLINESPASDAYEVAVAANIDSKHDQLDAERPAVGVKYSDVLITTNDNVKTWLEVKMNHTDNLANPRISFNGEEWITSMLSPAAVEAVKIANSSDEAEKFVNDLRRFVGRKNITIPTTFKGLRDDPNAVTLEQMKEFVSQPGKNRYIAQNSNYNVGKIVREHYMKGKAEPAYYLQAGDDFYRIGAPNPLNVPNDVPLVGGNGIFNIRVSTRSKFYEVQAEIKIASLKSSRYSLKPGTSKENPFAHFE